MSSYDFKHPKCGRVIQRVTSKKLVYTACCEPGKKSRFVRVVPDQPMDKH